MILRMEYLDSVPPPTEIPDYVLYSKRYQRPQFSRPNTALAADCRIVVHPDGESALKAAKVATKGKRDRYFGRGKDDRGRDVFNVYAGGKIVEQYVVK